MEQLGPFIENCKKHKFWIACGGCALVMLGIFFWSSRTINADKQSRISKINSSYNSVDAITKQNFETDGGTVPGHPNEITNGAVKDEIAEAAAAAYAAWQKQYQKQITRLVWPKGEMNDEAVNSFASQEAVELWPVAGNTNPNNALNVNQNNSNDAGRDSNANYGNIPEQHRHVYRLFIREYMPSVAKIVGASWKVGKKKDQDNSTKDDRNDRGVGGIGNQFGGGTGEDGGNGKIQNVAGGFGSDTVDWVTQNQQFWNDHVNNYKDKNGNTEYDPTPAQVMLIQQDLWILEALFRIVKKVNGDIKENDLVPIKQIDHVFSGQAAQGKAGSIIFVKPMKGAETKRNSTRDRFGKKYNSKEMGNNSGRSRAANKEEFDFKSSQDPLHGRYVNKNFEPMTDESVRKAASAKKLEGDPEYSVAKRVPFRMALIMDEREIDEFLAACGNSPFAVEVRQIRINRHVAGETGVDAGTAKKDSGGGGMTGIGQMNSDEDSGGGSTSSGTGNFGTDIATRTDYHVKVEFIGFVKIYYKPRPKLLDQPNANENAANKVAAN